MINTLTKLLFVVTAFCSSSCVLWSKAFTLHSTFVDNENSCFSNVEKKVSMIAGLFFSCITFEIRRALNVETLLSIERFQLQRFGRMSRMLDCPRKYWRGKPCWLHPREIGPKVNQGPGGVITLPTLLGPVLVRREKIYQRLFLTARYFQS